VTQGRNSSIGDAAREKGIIFKYFFYGQV